MTKTPFNLTSLRSILQGGPDCRIDLKDKRLKGVLVMTGLVEYGTKRSDYTKQETSSAAERLTVCQRNFVPLIKKLTSYSSTFNFVTRRKQWDAQ
jgi:hypothetical protein